MPFAKQKQLDDGKSVFQWSKILMSTLGLWPANSNNLIFTMTFGYFCYEMALEYLDLLLFIDNLEHVLLNLTENVAFSEIFIRILIMWIYRREFKRLIEEAQSDFSLQYNEDEEKILKVNQDKSKLFMKLLVANTAFTATSFYAKPLLGQFGEGKLKNL